MTVLLFLGFLGKTLCEKQIAMLQHNQVVVGFFTNQNLAKGPGQVTRWGKKNIIRVCPQKRRECDRAGADGVIRSTYCGRHRSRSIKHSRLADWLGAEDK